MSARDKLYAYAGTPSVLPESMLDEALDAYRAEVIAERDAEILRWLGKKAREYRATGRKADRERADLITVLASKISRGAVRPNNALLPAGVEPRFFEPGRTYQRGRWLFQCLAVAPRPFNSQIRAVGFLYRPGETDTVASLGPDNWTDDGWTETDHVYPVGGENAQEATA